MCVCELPKQQRMFRDRLMCRARLAWDEGCFFSASSCRSRPKEAQVEVQESSNVVHNCRQTHLLGGLRVMAAFRDWEQTEMYIYIYIYTDIYSLIRISSSIYTHSYIHIYIYIYMHIHECMCIPIQTHKHIYIYIYIWICLYPYMYMHVYVHIWTYTHTHTSV